MTLALVQTPVDLGYTAAHGHLLTLVPPAPPHQLHPPTLSPCLDSRCYRDQQQQQQQHQNEPTSSYQHQQCNGFVSKIPWSCSTAVLGPLVSTDDESSIPTPPPAASYPRDCPIHYLPAERSPYVTVHSPASGSSYPPLSSIRRQHHYQQKQPSQEMPDITAFSRMLVHQRRQFSSESENSGYKINANNPATSTNQTTICYQCHGAGHVAVALPLPSERPLMPYGSLPRDITASTVCSANMDSAEDEEEETGFHPRHQRSHSSGTNYHGSLRRITAVWFQF